MDLLKKAQDYVTTVRSVVTNYHSSTSHRFHILGQEEPDEDDDGMHDRENKGVGDCQPRPGVPLSSVAVSPSSLSGDTSLGSRVVPNSQSLSILSSQFNLPPLPSLALPSALRDAMFSLSTSRSGSSGGVAPSAPPQHSRPPLQCSFCQSVFNFFRWRMRCPVCHRVLCPRCYGRRAITKCCFDRGCGVCADIVQKHATFHQGMLPMLELGTACTLHRIAGGQPHSLQIWLNYDVDRASVAWRTLQMRNNRPLEKGEVSVGHIYGISSENKQGDSLVFIVLERQSRHLQLEFSDEAEGHRWNEALRLAWELFAPEEHRKEQEMYRQSNRRQILEDRLRKNEERKNKILSSGVGMHFTAEAMMKSS